MQPRIDYHEAAPGAVKAILEPPGDQRSLSRRGVSAEAVRRDMTL